MIFDSRKGDESYGRRREETTNYELRESARRWGQKDGTADDAEYANDEWVPWGGTKLNEGKRQAKST